MKRIFIVISMGFITMSISVFGQKTDSILTSKEPEINYKHGIGLNAGVTTGVGYAYRYWSGRSSYQITLLPLYDENKTKLSAGATYFREIRQYNDAKFVFYASNHLTNLTNSDNTYKYNLGVGAGIEVGCDFMVLSFLFGYGALDILDHIRTRPVIETGMFIKF